MFNNISGKIKTLAKVICWLGIIISIFIALVIFVTATDDYAGGLGLKFLIVGPILSWISSFILYGFGELIESNVTITEQNRTIITLLQKSINADSDDKAESIFHEKQEYVEINRKPPVNSGTIKQFNTVQDISKEEFSRYEREEKKGKIKKYIVIGILVLVVILMIFLFVKSKSEF